MRAHSATVKTFNKKGAFIGLDPGNFLLGIPGNRKDEIGFRVW